MNPTLHLNSNNPRLRHPRPARALPHTILPSTNQTPNPKNTRQTRTLEDIALCFQAMDLAPADSGTIVGVEGQPVIVEEDFAVFASELLGGLEETGFGFLV